MEITADVCGALDFSHRAGIVHRDIKPANVMITDAGAVKVMDFGIARAVADQSATVTQTANVIGTAQYLSPEQARGETVDARSDVYSTGCLLYELITGMPPFQGDSPVAVAYQHVRENPIPPSQRVPELPRVLDSIVMKALAKNQLNRYQSAGEMRADLQRALADEPVSAEAVMTDDERTQLIARTPPPVVSLHRDDMGAADDDRRPGLVWLVIVVALLLVIGAGAFAIRLLTGSGGTKTVTIPSVIGMTPTAAVQALKNDGLVPAAGDPTSGPCAGGRTVTEGLVCVVTPDVGAKVKDKSTVTFQVFEKRKVQVQTYVGEDYTQAANEVNGLGLHPVRQDVNNSQPGGTVVQQSPPPYTTVVVGSTVTLQVSTGKVPLPDVRGKPVAEAQTSLNSQGWTKVVVTDGTVSTTDKAKDGTVATENPQPGIAYPQSTQVTLTAYKYVPPPPPPTPTPTCTPTTPLAARPAVARRPGPAHRRRRLRRRGQAADIATGAVNMWSPATAGGGFSTPGAVGRRPSAAIATPRPVPITITGARTGSIPPGRSAVRTARSTG